MGAFVTAAQRAVNAAWWITRSPGERQWLRAQQYLRFAAAKGGRLMMGLSGTQASIDETLRHDLPKLRERSRQLCEDNEYAAGFIVRVKANVVGPHGVSFQSKVRRPRGVFDARVNDAIEHSWRDQSRSGRWDVTRRMSRRDFERLWIASAARDGEVMVRVWRNHRERGRYAVQIVESDLLDDTLKMDRFAATGNRIRMGVEIDAWGGPVAYHLLAEHPGDYTWQHGGVLRERVPASDMRHCFVPFRPHQTRGVPWMHAAIIALRDLGGYREAAIVAARVGAAKMGFLEHEPGSSKWLGDDADADGNRITDVNPGSFEDLPPGVRLSSWSPDYPHAQFDAFNKAILRGISTALGVAYHSLANDHQSMNFSSARSALLEERDLWMALQEWMIDSLHGWLYEDWLRFMLSSRQIVVGNVPLSITDFARIHAPTWQARRWPWVDPLKDIQAHSLAIEQRLRSRSDVIRELGRDPEEVWSEIQREEEQLEEMGIALGESVAPASVEEEEKDVL